MIPSTSTASDTPGRGTNRRVDEAACQDERIQSREGWVVRRRHRSRARRSASARMLLHPPSYVSSSIASIIVFFFLSTATGWQCPARNRCSHTLTLSPPHLRPSYVSHTLALPYLSPSSALAQTFSLTHSHFSSCSLSYSYPCSPPSLSVTAFTSSLPCSLSHPHRRSFTTHCSPSQMQSFRCTHTCTCTQVGETSIVEFEGCEI